MITKEQWERLSKNTKDAIKSELSYDSTKAIAAYKEEWPKGQDMVYIDYRDDLTDKQAQEIIQIGYSEDLENGSWIWESQEDSYRQILPEIARLTGFREEDLRNDDSLRDEIISNDTSNPMKDLLRNTSRKAMFYDLEFDDEGDNVDERSKQIAKVLKISYKKYQKELTELTANAFYGGRLCFYWYGDIEDLLPVENPDFKYIRIEDPEICIMDRMNGSGHSVKFQGLRIEADLKRKNIWLDKEAPGYSYGYDVCGLSMDAMENQVRLGMKTISKKEGYVKLEKSKKETELEKHAKKEKKWDEDLKENICHVDDPRYDSHDFEYFNQPPMCRHECKRCHRIIMD